MVVVVVVGWMFARLPPYMRNDSTDIDKQAGMLPVVTCEQLIQCEHFTVIVSVSGWVFGLRSAGWPYQAMLLVLLWNATVVWIDSFIWLGVLYSTLAMALSRSLLRQSWPKRNGY